MREHNPCDYVQLTQRGCADTNRIFMYNSGKEGTEEAGPVGMEKEQLIVFS